MLFILKGKYHLYNTDISLIYKKNSHDLLTNSEQQLLIFNPFKGIAQNKSCTEPEPEPQRESYGKP